MLLNKKGVLTSFVFLFVIIFSLSIPAFVVWNNSVNKATVDENYIEKSSVAFYEWRKIITTRSDEIKAKINKTETRTALSSKYDVSVYFGNYKSYESASYIPVEIRVKEKNKADARPFILKRDFFINKSADRFLLNDSGNNNVAMQWYPSEELIKFLVDGKQIVEESSEDFSRGNGYIVFDNGLMLQWGVINTNFDGGVKIATFAKPFPHKCMTVVTSTYQSHWIGGIRFNSVRGYDSIHAEFVPTGGNGDYKIFWMAFGN